MFALIAKRPDYRIADSSFGNAIRFSSAGTIKRFPWASMYVCNPDSSLAGKEMLTGMEIQFDQPHENKTTDDCGALLFRNGTVFR